MAELMAALGSDARRTVFRKLNELNYRTSYSHRGRYYTLDRIAEFGEFGLWSYRDVWFSIHGTLLSTVAALVEPGATGAFPDTSIMPDELRTAIILFFSVLDEKLRRLYAGLEALKTGRGSDARIAELLGLDITTVARGRRELLDQDVEIERVRRTGAGRRSMEKKRRK
ncbi:MAG: hypothetical protein KZQ89_01655 [Candidatus Thiodiazotropha sp. (ex Lucinoma kastoroae)]|nr:hypothetical protein [Candidatus Thiodiazotropha sp. (ex Lucinoma kastoroae)]